MPVAAATNILNGGDGDEDESILRIGLQTKVDSMNPNVGEIDSSYIFYGLVYDSIHVVDEDLNIVGGLCTDWYVDEDYIPYGSAWIMEFTQNARWHDGERFTADDVVFTLNLNCNNYTTMWANQPYTYYMNYAEKIDEYTVRVHYYDRDTGLPLPAAYARMIWFLILPEHLLRDWSPTDIAFGWEGVFDDTDPPIIGTGPFKVTDNIYEEFLAGDKLTFVKNEDYFWQYDREGSPEIQFDRLELHFFDDPTAMAIALENGDLDVTQLPPHEYHTLKGKVDNGQLENVAAFNGDKCTYYWTMISICANNAGPNPSRLDPVIREAISMAINKQHVLDNYYLGYGTVGTTMIPPVNKEWHYELTAEELYEYDIAEANDLLEQNGYRYTPDSPDVRVCTADSYAVQANLVAEGTPLRYEMAVRQECPEEKDVAAYLVSEWAKIGIGLEYTIMTEPALSTYVYGYMYDTMMWYWSGDPDPNYLLFIQTKMSWGGWSDNKYWNPAYDENYSLSCREFDVEKRREYTDNCQRIAYRDAHFIMMVNADATYGWRTDTFTGWGDWEAHPARSVDNFWSGNPLYFDLVPGEREPGEVPWLAIAAGVGVIAAAVVAVVALKRRSGKKGKPEKEKTSPLGE
ncbi:MAG: ABC transporter substrate-binding protein [Methanobacteriota archaeon]|nr:MAG: ABC transporter substrate-binding protein [Euryarchaeota archaeon]